MVLSKPLHLLAFSLTQFAHHHRRYSANRRLVLYQYQKYDKIVTSLMSRYCKIQTTLSDRPDSTVCVSEESNHDIQLSQRNFW